MMKIIELILKTSFFKATAFERATHNPMEAQKRVLFEYIKRNRDTEYGKKYNFFGIRSVREYQNLVPMSDSESIYPYIERMAKGEKGVLTKDDPIFFGLTSGTTNKPKLIPVTEFSRRKKAEVARLWAYYIVRDHPKILNGKILAIINPDTEGHAPSGIPYGAETGHGYKNLPWTVKKMYALPYDIFLIDDYDARYYCILRFSIEENITTIATLNPSTLILLCKKMEKWRDELIADIENGSINSAFNIPENMRQKLTYKLRPNPEKAAELKAILKDGKPFIPKFLWKNLELIECWKGGTVNIYLKELPQYFGSVKIRDFGCLSTEARSSIPMGDEGAEGVLAIKTNFYEFVPKEDMDKREKRFLLADQVEKGKEYFLIVTTPGGLYRYNIDDIVRIDGFFNNTPKIEFVQKGLNAVSVTGEKLYESQVNEAVNKAADKENVLIEFFSACVQWGHPPRYAFLVEFGQDPVFEKKKSFLREIEKELYAQNAEYLYVRKSQLLGDPVLKVVKKGEFERYRKKKVAEGMHDSQFKMPELVLNEDFQNNFEVLEEIRTS